MAKLALLARLFLFYRLRLRGRGEERLDIALPALEIGDALGHPFRGRLAEQEVVEELVEVDGPVFLVVPLPEAVLLTVEIEHVGFFAEAAEGGEELDPLVPRHGVVLVVVDGQVRRLDPLDPEERRVLEELKDPAPERRPDAALRLFVLESPRHAGAPADAA